MPKVSIFKSIKEVNNPENVDLFEYLEKTRDGEWEDIVFKCRLINDKEKRDEFKRTMPTTTLSGEFNSRNDSGLITHSGFIAMDLDEVDNIDYVRKQLQMDKHTYSVFMSASGRGLRVLFAIEPDRHKDAFDGISQYLYSKYSLIVDPNGRNQSKPYVVSFDPFIYINPGETLIFKKYVKEKIVKTLPDYVHTDSDFDNVMKIIKERGVNICEDYNDWLKLGFALAEQFGEAGRDAFHTLSSFSTKYNTRITDKQFTYCLRARGTTKVGISTFYYLAKQHNIKITSEKTKNVVRTTKNGKIAGLNKAQIIENLEKFSNITGVDDIVNKVFDSGSAEELDDDESLISQLEMFIANNYSLKMNEVTGYVEENDVRLKPSDLNTVFIAAKKLIPKLDYQLMMRLLKSDYIETYNPFFKFLGSDGIAVELPPIPTDDDVVYNSPLINKLTECIENTNPSFTHFFVRKWIVSIISAMHGVHSPLLLCLAGPPATGKTEWFRRLLPKELQEYYAESKLDKEKDDELLMTENIIIMDDELGGKSKRDNIKLKDITSKQHFSLRRPYGDHNEKILRLAVLGGTTNYPNDIIIDPSDNRRIIVIEVTNIDKELYNSIDKRQLFLEAFALYKQGFDWRITHKDMPYLNKDGEKYEIVAIEREIIERYFYPSESPDDAKLTTTDVKIELERITQQKLSIVNIGKELLRLGFPRKSTRTAWGDTSKKWCLKRINRLPDQSPFLPDEDPPF